MQRNSRNMLVFVLLGFYFDMVRAALNPCTDPSKFVGENKLGGMKCTDLSNMMSTFTPSDATCRETIALGSSSAPRYKFLNLALPCCPGTTVVCSQFELNICTDSSKLSRTTTVKNTMCADHMFLLDGFTPSAATCGQTVTFQEVNMTRTSMLSILNACCGDGSHKCVSHMVNPCQDPSNFQATSGCIAKAGDIAAFSASASTCSEIIVRATGESQLRKFAVHDLKQDCCGGKEVSCAVSSSEAALRITKWAKAGDSTCFAKSSKSLSATAVGACSGLAITSFFEQEMHGFFAVSGAEGAYLTDKSLTSEVPVTNFALDTNFNNQCCAPAMCGSACKGKATTQAGNYALVQTGMKYGQPDAGKMGGWAGIGYYAIKSGSIQTNLNDFLTDRGDDGFRMSRFACLKYDAAASAAAGNDGVYKMYTDLLASPSATTGAMPAVCGAATTYTAGQIKFSIYLEFGGEGFGAAFASATYLAFRTVITTTDVSSVFFNNNLSLTLDSLGSQDVTSVTFATSGAAHQMTVAFEKKYISGRIIDVTGNPTPTKPLAEADVKIKAARNASDSFFVDYLFEVTESMRAINAALHSGANNGGQYIVYDPSVSVGATTGVSTTATGATVASTTVAVDQPVSGAQLRKMSCLLSFLSSLFLLSYRP